MLAYLSTEDLYTYFLCRRFQLEDLFCFLEWPMCQWLQNRHSYSWIDLWPVISRTYAAMTTASHSVS